MYRNTLLFVTLLPLCQVPAASAQNTAQPQPCAESSGFGDFDFWIGDWAVYSNNDERLLYGHNSISKHQGGCLLKEQWQSVGGNTGFSINYFNNVTNEWRQVWVADGYSIDYTGGLTDAGAMRLEGHIYNYAEQQSTPFRGIWTPLENGDVLQHFDIYDPEQEAWTVWFEGLYVKVETDERER